MQLKQYLRQGIATIFGLNVLSLLWAASLHRPMNADGAMWYFVVANFHTPYVQQEYFRWISSLLQWPAVAFARVFPQEWAVSWSSLLLSLSFCLHPVISVVACYLLLKVYRQVWLMCFVLLSFALCSLALASYSTLVIPETLSVFWPLFLLLLVRNGSRLWEVPLGLVLCGLMAFSYEAAGLLVGINICLLLGAWRRGLSQKGDFILIGAHFLALGFLFWRVMGPMSGPIEPFYRAVTDFVLDPYREWVFFCLFLILIIAVSGWYRVARSRMVIAVVCCLLLVGIVRFGWILSKTSDWSTLFYSIWNARTTVIPVASILASLAIIFFWRKVLWYQTRSILLSLVLVALWVGLLHDLALTVIWRGGYLALQELRKNEGCNIISFEAHEKAFQRPFAIGTIFFSYMSTAPEQVLNPPSLFIVEKHPTGASCKPSSSGALRLDDSNFELPIAGSQRVNYSQVLTPFIGIFEWDEATKSVLRTRSVAR